MYFCIEISVIEGSLESLKHNGQSLSVKLSELEEMERRVNEELEELELVSWNDKLQIETVRCAQLEADAEALMSKTAWTETEIDRWQRQVVEITTLTETTKTNSQQMDDNKTRLKEQVMINLSTNQFTHARLDAQISCNHLFMQVKLHNDITDAAILCCS